MFHFEHLTNLFKQSVVFNHLTKSELKFKINKCLVHNIDIKKV